jgi:predicted TPR repeat methyltransferase
MYQKMVRFAGRADPIERVLEWGPGGGVNALQFIDQAPEYWGVEISQASLDECARVLTDAGYGGFRPVLISAEDPERAASMMPNNFDLFLCTYVFELLPGRQYGERVAQVAFDALRAGGMALIQIRYDDGTDRSSQKRGDYFQNACRFTSYRIEDFWNRMESIGFRPLYVQLVTKWVDGFSGDLYAYFSLVKPAMPTNRAGETGGKGT